MGTARREELCPRALQLPRQVCSLLGAYVKASLFGAGGGGEDPPSRHRIWLPFHAADGLGRRDPGDGKLQDWQQLTSCSPTLSGCLLWVFFVHGFRNCFVVSEHVTACIAPCTWVLRSWPVVRKLRWDFYCRKAGYSLPKHLSVLNYGEGIPADKCPWSSQQLCVPRSLSGGLGC